jgi:hypothetical protein
LVARITQNQLLRALNAAGVPVDLTVDALGNLNTLAAQGAAAARAGRWPVSISGILLDAAVQSASPTIGTAGVVVRLPPDPVTLVPNQPVTLGVGTAVVVQGLDVVSGTPTSITEVTLASQPALVVASVPYSSLVTAQNGGSVNGPAAGAVIATLTPGAGTWEITCWAATALGVPVAGDEANMGYYRNAVLQTVLPHTSSLGGPFGPFRVILAAVDTVSVRAIGAGTAGVVYVAGILARSVA